jgi:hypothetical protein
MSEEADRAGYTCLRYGHWWMRNQGEQIRFCKVCGIHQTWSPEKWENVKQEICPNEPKDCAK